MSKRLAIEKLIEAVEYLMPEQPPTGSHEGAIYRTLPDHAASRSALIEARVSLTAAREQQPARGDAVSFQRESSGGYSLHTPHDPAPGEQQTREQGLAADECLAGCGEPRDSTASRYCATCRKAIERVAPAQEPVEDKRTDWTVTQSRHAPTAGEHWELRREGKRGMIGFATAKGVAEHLVWALNGAEQARDEAIERAERAERERDKWIKVAESVERGYTAEQARAEAAEHERDEFRAAIERHQDFLRGNQLDHTDIDEELWAVLSKEEGAG